MQHLVSILFHVPPLPNGLEMTIMKNSWCNYANFAQQVASVHSQQGNNNVRRGISLILSFVAAVLVEAIIISSNRSQSIKDSTVRALLPHILDAVQGKHIECADWRSFGCVLISTLLDNCTLNNDVKEVLATYILKGVIPTSTAIALSSSDKINNGHELNNASIQTLENVANAIVAVLSILIKIENHDDKNLLLGYNMPMSTYRAMVKLHHLLPSTLGFLFDERNLDVKPVLSSLLSISISRLLTSDIPVKSNTRRDSISSDSKRGNVAMEVLLSLVRYYFNFATYDIHSQPHPTFFLRIILLYSLCHHYLLTSQ